MIISYQFLIKSLVELVEKSPTVIKALALQLHHRLSQRIY